MFQVNLIHLKNQALISQKDKGKKIKMSSAAIFAGQGSAIGRAPDS